MGRGKRKEKYESESASDVSSDESGPPRKRMGKQTGFTKDLQLSTELAAIVGTSKAPRHEVVKQLWAYIKENNLQDPTNKQFEGPYVLNLTLNTESIIISKLAIGLP